MGRKRRECNIQTFTKFDGKGAGLDTAPEPGQLGCCVEQGCGRLTKGNVQLVMCKALCGKLGQNLVVNLSKKHQQLFGLAGGSVGENRESGLSRGSGVCSASWSQGMNSSRQ